MHIDDINDFYDMPKGGCGAVVSTWHGGVRDEYVGVDARALVARRGRRGAGRRGLAAVGRAVAGRAEPRHLHHIPLHFRTSATGSL